MDRRVFLGWDRPLVEAVVPTAQVLALKRGRREAISRSFYFNCCGLCLGCVQVKPRRGAQWWTRYKRTHASFTSSKPSRVQPSEA